jgi:PilZ domain-containing protein
MPEIATLSGWRKIPWLLKKEPVISANSSVYDERTVNNLQTTLIVLVTAKGQELRCTAADLSLSGMRIEGLTTVPDYQAGLQVRFRLPGSDTSVEIPGRLAWADIHGHAGIAFTDVSTAARQEIRRWLYQKMLQEGWTVPSDPPESLAE